MVPGASWGRRVIDARAMKAFFRNRADAGRQLAGQLTGYAGQGDVLVLGLPRGGVTVAFEVAQRLNAPLDVLVVRKLGVPGHEELAMGAIATGGIRVLNEEVVRSLGIPEGIIDAAADIRPQAGAIGAVYGELDTG